MTYKQPSISNEDYRRMMYEIHDQGGFNMDETLKPHDGMFNCTGCKERVRFGHVCSSYPGMVMTVMPIHDAPPVEAKEVLAVVEGLVETLRGAFDAAGQPYTDQGTEHYSIRAARRLMDKLREAK